MLAAKDGFGYRKRHYIENMFGKLKDWCCVVSRHDCCAQTFMSGIVTFWI